MPWHVAKTAKCPASKPWGVIKDSDDSVAGCHPTEEKAKDHMAALYANDSAEWILRYIRDLFKEE